MVVSYVYREILVFPLNLTGSLKLIGNNKHLDLPKKEAIINCNLLYSIFSSRINLADCPLCGSAWHCPGPFGGRGFFTWALSCLGGPSA